MSIIDADDYAAAMALLEELLELDSGLTSWEIGFIESLDEWDGHFTEGQYEKLQEVHNRHL